MNQRIIYQNSEGGVSIIVPAGAIEDCIKDVPAGTTYEIVDVSAVPSDRTFRNAWVKAGNAVQTNLPKAKGIAHDKRRARREVLFAPHDAVIMKQIPGKDMTAAEQARADIRQADALVQETIDNATTAQQLKDALIAYGAIA